MQYRRGASGKNASNTAPVLAVPGFLAMLAISLQYARSREDACRQDALLQARVA